MNVRNLDIEESDCMTSSSSRFKFHFFSFSSFYLILRGWPGTVINLTVEKTMPQPASMIGHAVYSIKKSCLFSAIPSALAFFRS